MPRQTESVPSKRPANKRPPNIEAAEREAEKTVTGHRPLPRDHQKTLKPKGRDASGPAKDTAPQQSREALRTKGG